MHAREPSDSAARKMRMTFDQPDLLAAQSIPRQDEFTPTRRAGLTRLSSFLPRAGTFYARERNADLGPENRAGVSMLSPWIRRRLVSEREVVAAVLAAHGHARAEKFVQEVFWRTYWKGWLEARPAVHARFLADLAAAQELAREGALARRLAAAQAGETGVACFDVWAQELNETGFLHNHARMWFASIWLFTLELPLSLGVDFFARRLIDHDPASNLLSWRWVAGLHTPGKHYVATAHNIRLNTGGRFDPRGELNEAPAPLTEQAAPTQFSAQAIAPASSPDALEGARVALLLTQEDLHAESLAPVAAMGVAGLRSADMEGEGPAAAFSRGAMEDALARASAHFAAPNAGALDEAGVLAWAQGLGAAHVLTAYAPVGAIAHDLRRLEASLARAGVRLLRVRRAWDEAAWPHARAGFFKFREKIPRLIYEAGLTA